MPSHCCVPYCTFKGYRSKTGEKISFFNFPKSKELEKKWIVAIRRDPGKHFELKKKTKVCSRHFLPTDLKKSWNGIITLKKDAVPSVFPWSREGFQNRKPPKDRQSTNEVDNGLSCSELPMAGNEGEHTLVPKTLEEQLKEEILALKERLTALEDRVKIAEADLNKKSNEYSELLLRYEAACNEHKLTKHELFMKDNQTKELRDELESLNSMVFSLSRFESKENISFYTGFPNIETFMAILNFLNTGSKGENLRYCTKKQDVPAEFYNTNEQEDGDECEEQENDPVSKKGRSRKLQAKDQFFMVMCRLRRGFKEQHLAHLFGVSQSTVSRIFISWINYMFLKFGQINIWPSKEIVLSTMPEAFKEKYGNTRIIIDCTEIRCEMPSSLLTNSELFSSYKNHQTLKALIGIAPSGAITFISELYTGLISDREIVIRSGLLKQSFEPDDEVMADKGFTIEDILPLGININYPPFLGSNGQMSADEVIETQRIASLRIHVERAINRIKNYRIWQGDFPLSLIGVSNQMWAVCAFLSNTQDPLISA